MSKFADAESVSLRSPTGVGGWLLVLCIWLMVWQPLNLGVAASNTLTALPLHGFRLGLVLVVRLLVAGLGIAAGIALFTRRPAARPLARLALVASALTDTFVYTSTAVPGNLLPGAAPFYVAATLACAGGWLLYLARSTRVHSTYEP